MDTTSIRSIGDGVLCRLKPSHTHLPMSEVKETVGNSPHAGILQDPHYPLDAIHGHTLLESAEACERRRYSSNLFFYEQCQLIVSDRLRYVCEADGFLWSMWEDRLAVSVARKSSVTQSPWIDSSPRPSTREQVRNLFSSTCGALANKTFL